MRFPDQFGHILAALVVCVCYIVKVFANTFRTSCFPENSKMKKLISSPRSWIGIVAVCLLGFGIVSVLQAAPLSWYCNSAFPDRCRGNASSPDCTESGALCQLATSSWVPTCQRAFLPFYNCENNGITCDGVCNPGGNDCTVYYVNWCVN